MGETQDIIDPQAKFLFSYQCVKLDKLCDSKSKLGERHRGDRHGGAFPFQKGGIIDKEGVTGPY